MEASNEMSVGAEDSYWDVKDVMRVLRVKKSWVYAKVESGELPGFRMGGLIRFDPKDVRAYVQRCKTAVAAPRNQ